MNRPTLSRRTLLLAAASGLGCGRKRATGIPGFCFVAAQGSRTVSAISLERFRVVRQIPLDGAPSAVLAHPTKPKLFVLAPDNGTVYEIDALALSVSRRARAGNQAVAMQMAPGNDALWVLYRDPATLVELPLDTLRARRTVRLPAPPDAFDLVSTKDNHALAAVAIRKDRTVALASLASSAIERTINVGAEPSLLCFQKDGARLITASQSERAATIFDVPSGKTVVRLPLPVAPRHLCTTSDGGQLFVTGDGMDAVVVIFPYDSEVYQTILAGHAPASMAVTSTDVKPSYLLVANPDSDRVTVLDIDTYKLVAVVQVGKGPGQILLTPDSQYALVLNEQSGDLAVIRTLALGTTPNGGQRRYAAAPLFTLIPVGDRPISAAVVTVA